MRLLTARRSAGTGVAIAAMLVAGGGPALADKPILIEDALPLEQGIPFQCHGVEGVLYGTGILRLHFHETPDGEELVIAHTVEREAYFTTHDGDTYRVRGSVIAKALSGGEPGPVGDDIFFRRANLAVIGPNGRLGSMHERIDGDEVVVHGGCDYLGDVPGR